MKFPNLKLGCEDASLDDVANFLTPELKAFLATQMLVHYSTGKRRKKGSRLQFDIELYTAYLFDACKEAVTATHIPEHAQRAIGVLLSNDDGFFEEVANRSHAL